MPVDETLSPDGDGDGHDDQTQAWHVATRAELLPEEQAVGSDDPQAQATGILQESEERLEDSERDANSE